MNVELHITREYTPDSEAILRALAIAADVPVDVMQDALVRAVDDARAEIEKGCEPRETDAA